MKRKNKLTIAIATAAVLGGTAIAAQDKYTFKLPDGLPFSDWKGYEDWQLISTSRTDARHCRIRRRLRRFNPEKPCPEERST